MGSNAGFESDQYLFSWVVSANTVAHIYGKTTRDLVWFNSILSSFYANTERNSYMDEVLAASGIPIWIEGPLSVAESKWGNGIYGLPRFLGTGKKLDLEPSSLAA